MLTSKGVRLFVLLLTALIFPAAAALASVDFTPGVAVTSINACPGAATTISYVQLQTTYGGTIDVGSIVLMSLTGGAVLYGSTPTLDSTAPAGLTLTATPGSTVLSLTFGSGATLAAGSSIIIRNVGILLPTSVGTGVVVNGVFSVLNTASITFSVTSTVAVAYVSPSTCNGHMTVSASALTFGSSLGSDPDPQSITIQDLTRPGVSLGLVVYVSDQSAPAGWLNPQPITESSGVATLQVVIYAKSMPEGTYTGHIQILTLLRLTTRPSRLPSHCRWARPASFR